MSTTDDILALAAEPALAAHPAPAEASAQAAADLIRFAEAVSRGIDTDVIRALRALRPGSLPDSPAWRAWLSATAAAAATQTPAPPTTQTPPTTQSPPAAQTALFTMCAAASALGDDCSAAVAAGTQAAALTYARLAAADPAEQVGWSLPAVSAVIGAGLAAGIMLGLPEPALRHALGLCATQAAGLRAAFGTAAGPLQAGKAAFNAVEAALLAELGFTSSREPLDGRRGLFALFNPL